MLSINDPDSYINLGNTYKELGNLKGAEKNYRVAIDLKPDYAQAFSNLGNILYDLGKFEQALINFEKALELNPYFVQAYSNMGFTQNG